MGLAKNPLDVASMIQLSASNPLKTKQNPFDVSEVIAKINEGAGTPIDQIGGGDLGAGETRSWLKRKEL